MSAVARVALASLIPIAAATAGAVWATWTTPDQRVRSAIQHFAAGLVFAVAATELVPDMKAEHNAAAVVVGFVLGLATMLGIEAAAKRLSSGGESPVVTVVVTAVDVLVDGLLLGIGFAEGGKVGPLLTLALTCELLGLGVALTLALQPKLGRRAILATTGTSSLILVGGVLGATSLSHLAPTALSVVLAFATVALLYLVTEELLAEAHETTDTPALTAMFFVGFLIILLLSFSGSG